MINELIVTTNEHFTAAAFDTHARKIPARLHRLTGIVCHRDCERKRRVIFAATRTLLEIRRYLRRHCNCSWERNIDD